VGKLEAASSPGSIGIVQKSVNAIVAEERKSDNTFSFPKNLKNLKLYLLKPAGARREQKP
jgi:hypothetical protein